MGQHTTESDGGADEGVELLVATDGELKMTRSYTLDLEIFGSITREFQNFSGKVLEHSGDVDGSYVASEWVRLKKVDRH